MFKVGEMIWFMNDGKILNKKIHIKQERLCTMNHKDIEVSYIALSDRCTIHPIEYTLTENDIFKTKEELLCNFVKKNT